MYFAVKIVILLQLPEFICFVVKYDFRNKSLMKFSWYKNFQADSEEEHQKTKDKKKTNHYRLFPPHTRRIRRLQHLFRGSRITVGATSSCSCGYNFNCKIFSTTPKNSTWMSFEVCVGKEGRSVVNGRRDRTGRCK